MDQVSMGVAFIAGLLSFLSPCVLPLVPGYISFLSGVSLEELRQGAASGKVMATSGVVSVFFVLGFSAVFIALGASATFIGRLLEDNIVILTKIAGAVIVVLGLHLIGIFRINWLNYQKKFEIKRSSPGILSAFMLGLAFGFGWTPCIGPILAGILAIAASQETMLQGMLLLGVYAMGIGIPFIITGFAVGLFMRFFERYRKFIRAGEVAAGIFLIGIGVLIFTDNLTLLMEFVPESFYKFSK